MQLQSHRFHYILFTKVYESPTCSLHDDYSCLIGPLTTAGKAFIRNGYKYPVPQRILDKTIKLESPFHRTVRGILGYIHLITAAIFVGTIFFVHIFLKPKSLRGGIPGGEKKLGLSCMSILTASGIYLTWYRLDKASAFFDSRFGILLFIKILLFVLLLSLGILAVTLINKRRTAGKDGSIHDGSGLRVVARFLRMQASVYDFIR